MKKLLGATFLGIICFSSVFALGDPVTGKIKAATCTACHGPDGNSMMPNWPKLAGQNERYLVKQMNDFKNGKKNGRENAIMYPMVANLKPQDMEDIAAYFASQKSTIGMADKNLVPVGQALYRGGDLDHKIPACSACHGPQGHGNAEAGFPHLSGQHADYVAKQLKDYHDGVRTNGPIMLAIGKQMSDEQIKAVSNYINGLY